MFKFCTEIIGAGKYNSELVNFLHNKGHKVKVITSPKYYPDWKIQNNKYEFDKNYKFKVYRCPIYVPKKPTGIKRILHLISFSITSFPILIFQLFWKPDTVILICSTIICFIKFLYLNYFLKKFIYSPSYTRF